jgi:pimeloyl-ACP methyl ester carboxylesterase
VSDESRPGSDAPPRVHVSESGDGPSLLFTHGLGDSTETWAELRDALPGFRTLAWDLPGHGRSAKPEDASAYSREIALSDLDTVVARTGADAVLVGHSLGGYLTQCRAISNPQGLRALVLIATGPGFGDPERRERWNHYVRKAADRFDIPAQATRLGEQHDDLVVAHLEKLTLPVLQICGERDDGYHAALALLERKLPDVRTLRIAGAGHHVHRSHAEAVADAIRDFLAGLPPT